MLAARQQQRVDHAIAAYQPLTGAFQFGIEESQIEHRVMRDELGVAEKIDELSDALRE